MINFRNARYEKKPIKAVKALITSNYQLFRKLHTHSTKTRFASYLLAKSAQSMHMQEYLASLIFLKRAKSHAAALKNNALLAKTQYRLGNLCYAKGKFQKAMRHYENSLAVCPEQIRPLLNMLSAARDMGFRLKMKSNSIPTPTSLSCQAPPLSWIFTFDRAKKSRLNAKILEFKEIASKIESKIFTLRTLDKKILGRLHFESAMAYYERRLYSAAMEQFEYSMDQKKLAKMAQAMWENA